MANLDNQFVRDLCRQHSSAIVGRLCKQIEILQKQSTLSEEQKFNILKDFNRELIYEEFRDLENIIKFYKQGKVYRKLEIYKPQNPTTGDTTA